MSLEDYAVAGSAAASAPQRAYVPEQRPSWTDWVQSEIPDNVSSGDLERPYWQKPRVPAPAPGSYRPRVVILDYKFAPGASELEKAIQESSSLLELEYDWDGEGGLPCTKDTWNRAVEFLRAGYRGALEHRKIVAPVPRIHPGPDGSIDLHWDSGEFELLVNIPADPNSPADFYGDRGEKNLVKGKHDITKDCSWIFIWMTM